MIQANELDSSPSSGWCASKIPNHVTTKAMVNFQDIRHIIKPLVLSPFSLSIDSITRIWTAPEIAIPLTSSQMISWSRSFLDFLWSPFSCEEVSPRHGMPWFSDAQYRNKLPRTMSGIFYCACCTSSNWGYGVEYVHLKSVYNDNSSVGANLSFLPCGKYTRNVDCCNGLLLCHSSKGRTPKYYVLGGLKWIHTSICMLSWMEPFIC